MALNEVPNKTPSKFSDKPEPAPASTLIFLGSPAAAIPCDRPLLTGRRSDWVGPGTCLGRRTNLVSSVTGRGLG